MPLPTCQCNAGLPTQQQLANIYCALWTIVDGGGAGGGLPDQAGHAGEFLTTNGTDASWVPLAGGGDVVASGALTAGRMIVGGGGTTISASAFAVSGTTLTATGANAHLVLSCNGNGEVQVTGGAGLVTTNFQFSSVGAGAEVPVADGTFTFPDSIRTVSGVIIEASSGTTTGTGALVRTTSPTITTPTFGATATTGVTGTGNIVLSASPTLTGTVTMATAAVTTANITTFTIGGFTMTFPGSAATIARTDAAQTFTGTQTLAENASVALDPALSADGTFTGITINGTAGATLAFGDLIYLAVADSRWELVDADSVTTAGAVLTGMCVLAAAADGNATVVLLQGNIRADANFPALTIGAPVYASTTPGDIQVAQPSGTDDVVQVVGFALTADSIYFNPSQNYITVV